MRLFFAIECPLEIRKRAFDAANSIVRQMPILKAKAVPIENLHITLAFLGEKTEEELARITETFSSLSFDINAFDLELYGAGAFPDHKFPRIIWIGAKDASASLIKLYNQVSDALARHNIAFDDKKGFRPHLTVARIRDPKRAHGFDEVIANKQESFGKWKIGSFVLFESRLQRPHSMYIPQQGFSFKRDQ
ncbi:RNA 2',3'-cyclic phosphodiesterase [Elusimicrobiota bacterium]